MLPTRSRRDNTMANVPIGQVQTSQFDLSHYHRTSLKFGWLTPFFMKPTMPNDRWYIGAEALVRMPKLFAPIMEQVEFHMAWYYVSNDIIYDQWKATVKPALGGAGAPVSQFPYLTLTLDDQNFDPTITWNLLTQYMGLNTTLQAPVAGITWKFNALPIAAYWKIWNDIYRRPQIQPEWGLSDVSHDPLKPLGLEEPLIRNLDFSAGEPYNVNTMFQTYHDDWRLLMGFTTTVAQGYLQPVPRNWNPDYFTMATFEPQYGEEVQIPMLSDNLNFPLTNDQKTKVFRADTGAVPTSSDIQVTSGNLRATEAGVDIFLDSSGTAGTLAQLRFAESMQKVLEKLNRAGDRYRNYIREFFGVDPSPGADDYTVFIGQHTGIIPITEVFSTSATRGANDQIGEGVGAYSGRGIGNATTRMFQYHCKEHGHIIGICNIQNRSGYYQGIDKVWLQETWEDIPLADFAHTGDEPIQNRELVVRRDIAFDHADNTATFGYVPKYSWMKYSNDVVSGELRITRNAFHLARTIDENETPILDGEFLLCVPNITRVMETSASSSDAYLWIWNQAIVIRNLPKYSVPML